MVHAPVESRLRRTACLLLFFLLLPLSATPAFAQGDSGKQLPRAARRWVERTLKRLTLEEKVGQLLMVPYFGAFSNNESEEFARLSRQVRELHVGGFVVATRPRKPSGIELTGVYALARLTNRLQQLARTPLLVAGDFERGASFRVHPTTVFPHNMAVGATGDPKYAEALGRAAAIEARALGVHWVLAPVADVNNNPENPVINIRSFGEDPEQVAAMVAAFVRGCEENGALCTAKHFPGHGDTATDSHLSLPVIAVDRARLDAVELAPFRAAIAAGVSTIMPGHLIVPALEPDPQLPATFSSALLTDLLRRELGFDGLIITDAMAMNAIAENYWAGEAAVRAVEAGVDVILMSPQPEVAFAALKRAVESGRLTQTRLDESVRRILEAKARLNLHHSTQVELNRLEAVLASPEFEQQALEAADRGITLLRDHAGLLPLDSTRPRRGFLLLLAADANAFPGRVLEKEIESRVDSLLTVRADPLYFTPEEVELPSPDLYDWSMVAVFVRVASGKGDLGFPDELAELVERVLADGKPTVLVILGSPYLAERFPDAGTVLATFSTAATDDVAVLQASQDAMVRSRPARALGSLLVVAHHLVRQPRLRDRIAAAAGSQPRGKRTLRNGRCIGRVRGVLRGSGEQ
ncbi:MAG: hypothetical protein IH789_12425 [Acidobacteria bacterium]|nr:hypothetical protein [Acidobacteriota bacterium]